MTRYDPNVFPSAAQVVVARYLYDPFGNLLSQSGPLADANLYRFSSKEWHQNSGLVYYLYRFYDSGLQRWLNRDPLSDAGGLAYFVGPDRNLSMRPNNPLENWQGSNLFEFTRNDPILLIDKDGRIVPVIVIGGVTIGIAETVAAAFGLSVLACMADRACSAALKRALSQAIDKVIEKCRPRSVPKNDNTEECTLSSEDASGCHYSCPKSGMIWAPKGPNGCPDVYKYDPGSIPREE
jgi:RHS repeat-associated protein